jgi:hypothetical protein
MPIVKCKQCHRVLIKESELENEICKLCDVPENTTRKKAVPELWNPHLDQPASCTCQFVCSTCGKLKDSTEFPKRNYTRKQLPVCKTCTKLKTIVRAAKNG